LFLSYAALALIAVVAASGASLALYARHMSSAARDAMRNQATTLANVLAALDGDQPLPARQLAAILYADPGIRRRPRPFLVVDATGRPIISIFPPRETWTRPRDGASATPAGARRDGTPPVAERGEGATPPAARPQVANRETPPTPGDRRSQGSANRTPGAAILSRPFQVPGARYVPRPPSAGGEPVISEVELGRGGKLLYVTVLLAPEIDTSAADLAWLREPVARPLYVVDSRFEAEVRGLWQPLLPSIALVGSLTLALASLIAYGLARSITRPLEAMTQASERIAAGDYTVRVPARGAGEIGRLAAAFNAMAHQVGEAQRRQRDFVVNVSHDLRTPLTAIRGFARALVDGTARTDAQRRKSATAIESASRRMAALVEALIDLARLEGQQGGMQQQRFAAAALLSRVVEDHRPMADTAGVRLIFAAPADLHVAADPTWMSRALGNLVDNAIQHSPPGGEVRLAAGLSAAGAVEIHVSDAGAGIPPEDLPRIFERFYRGDRARTTNGRGLGLAIAREIIEGHDGTITIDSTPGQGTHVTVRLPMAEAGRPGP